jgi:hypothetical protein
MKFLLISILLLIVNYVYSQERNMTLLVGYGSRHEDDKLLSILTQVSEKYTEPTDITLHFEYESQGGYLTYVNISYPADIPRPPNFRVVNGWNQQRSGFFGDFTIYNVTSFEFQAKVYGFNYTPGPIYP